MSILLAIKIVCIGYLLMIGPMQLSQLFRALIHDRGYTVGWINWGIIYLTPTAKSAACR
jgi:uncharacterized membrane protein YciS (DUF1049 family)